jgi:hypothetical protein
VSRIIRSVFSPSSLRDGLVPLVNIWHRQRQRIFDSYHPELHYMRGPGPKWREKHAHAVSVLSVSRYR